MKKPIHQAVLKFLRNHLRPHKGSWIWAVTQYVVWNIINYVWGEHSDDYYTWFFINMSLFIALCFWSLAGLLPPQYIKYKWVLNTLTCIAISKGIYTTLVITECIKESKTISIAGSFFILMVGIIILKWPKR